MSQFVEEVRKNLIKSISGLLLILVIMVSILTFSLDHSDEIFSRSDSNEEYRRLLVKMQGEVTQEKEEELLEFISNSTVNFHLMEKFRDKVMSKELEGLMNLELKASDVYRDYRVAKYYEQQLNYINDDTTKREFVDASKWNKLFIYSKPDYIVVLFIAYFAAVLIDFEVVTEMSMLNETSYYAKKRLLRVKMLLIVMVSFVVIVMIDGTRFLIVNPGTQDSHISSLAIFENTPWNLSLIELYGVFMLSKILVIVVSGFISVYLTKKFESIFLSFVLVGSLVWLPQLLLPYAVHWKRFTLGHFMNPYFLFTGDDHFLGEVIRVGYGVRDTMVHYILLTLIIFLLSFLIIYELKIPKLLKRGLRR